MWAEILNFDGVRKQQKIFMFPKFITKYFRPTARKAGILLFSGFCISLKRNEVVGSVTRNGQIIIFMTTPTITILKTQLENQVSSLDPTINLVTTLFMLRK